uniref:Pre-mRNA-splicing factor 38 n=1 Tax=Proboscia inermis TaxID=420281 RepID=A0A7S0CB72_9STRA|mmetsp:Transcript_36726/g.36996  ORF Transcript_36726/g.36996 Transcript_36726/m.36996 type:complete len:324 (+) Transcript_36726:162-1133(+)
MCMDEFIDSLLRDDFVCGIAMPRLPKRSPLEEAGYLEMRTSVLGDADTAEEKLSELAKRGVDAAQEALMKRKMASVVETERNVRGDRDRSSGKKALDDAELVAKKEDATPHEKRRSSRKNSRSRSRSRSWGRRDSDDEKRGRYQDRDIDHERKVQQRNNDDYRGYYDKQESRYRDNKREDYDQNDHKSYNNVDSESYYYGNDSRSSRKRDDDAHQCNYNESSSRHTRRKEDRENCREVDRGRYDRSSRSEEDRYNDDKSNRRKEKRRKRDKDSYGSLFKKDHSSHSKKRTDKYDDEKNNGAEMEGSEEYWNDQRAKLGLKPLK